MKNMIINVNDLTEFMKLEELEKEICVKLNYFKEMQELQLKRLEEIKNIAKYLSNFKNGKYKEWYKQLDPELKKYIDKYRQK